jgi:2-desacetyl-2-hydroxyethyl bacteriochlorophyllide A dehydrogenase
MKAIELTKYGSPEFLQMKEVEKPSPKDHEILIKIHATSVSSGDARMRRADPFIIRLIFGFKRPRKPVLGVVVAGEIEAIGKRVTNYKVGDQVFGSSGMNFGAHAEYVAVSEDAVLALKPGNMSYEEAAAIPFGATASMHFLRIAKIQQGQKVLIYGASGALGTMAIQLAKNYGADVTAVCSTSNLELMKSLGADEVIDYTKEDFSNNGKKYDVLFDTIGKISLRKALRSLNKNGYLLLASAGIGTMIGGSIKSIFISKKIVSGVIKETAEDMNFFKQEIEKGKLKAVIDRIYTLKQIAEAHAYVDKGHKKGNVVIAIN